MKNLKRNSKKQFTKSFLDKKEIQTSVKLAKAELFLMCENLLTGKLAFKYENRICTAHPVDFPRCLIEWSRNSSVDTAIRNIIVSSFFSTEANQGGSGVISCMLWSGFILSCDHMKRFAEISDIDDVVGSWSPSGVSAAVAKKLVRLGACGRPVVLEEGSHLGTVVKCISGEKIQGAIDPLFDSKVNTNDMSGKFYGVAIDGIVESVSQIHKILESNTKKRIVVLARGFLPDVANTLAENWISKRLGVVPFVVSSWGVKNFLDLRRHGFECVSADIGSEIRNTKLQKMISMSVAKRSVVYGSREAKNRTRITVSCGSDLGPLMGIALDRIKTLLALSRFVARSGVARIETISKFAFFVPNSSVEAAQRAKRSLENILQNLGGVIITTKR